jgi:hypothetical protein
LRNDDYLENAFRVFGRASKILDRDGSNHFKFFTFPCADTVRISQLEELPIGTTNVVILSIAPPRQ